VVVLAVNFMVLALEEVVVRLSKVVVPDMVWVDPEPPFRETVLVLGTKVALFVQLPATFIAEFPAVISPPLIATFPLTETA
jgi:hypothetical protein